MECALHAARFILRHGGVDALPAKLPIRSHASAVINVDIMIIKPM